MPTYTPAEIMLYATVASAIGTCLSAIVILFTAIFALKQVWEIRVATYATAHKAVYDLLSSPQALNARRIVFTQLKKRDFRDWNLEQREAADETCRSFDAAAQMVSYHFVQEKFVADHWAQPLEDGWEILELYVEDIREKRQAYEKWDNFQDLAKKAKKHRLRTPKKKRWWQHR